MSIRIIEDGPEITLTRSEHERLIREWHQVNMYSSRPMSFEDYVRMVQNMKQQAFPKIDPSMLPKEE